MTAAKTGQVVRMTVTEKEWQAFKDLTRGRNKTVKEVLTDYVHHEIIKQADRKMQEES